MKRVYATLDPVEAEVLRALLRDAGIESAIDSQGGAAFVVGLPSSPLGIHVSDEDAASAAEILGRHFEKKDAETEPDPEAPPPMTPEESEEFERQVQKGKPRRRFWLALILAAFAGLWIIVYAVAGNWQRVGLGVGGLLAWFGIDALAGLGRKKKEPAS